MPLKRGKSKKVISSNIQEMLHKYKKTGRIGKVNPRDMLHARQIAAAAAYSKAKKKKKKGKKVRKHKKREFTEPGQIDDPGVKRMNRRTRRQQQMIDRIFR